MKVKTKNLLIIGARGWGREVYDIFKDCQPFMGDLKCKGFLDDKKDALDCFNNYPPIISSVEDYLPQDDDVFICALGNPHWVKHYSSIIQQKGGIFINLIHPTAILGTNSKLGYGDIVGSYANISNDVNIGNFCVLSTKSGIGHDSSIGNYCHIGGLTNISGKVEIDEEVTIHPGSNILPNIKIGKNSIIGAGSVVIKNIKPNTTVFGIPAKILNI